MLNGDLNFNKLFPVISRLYPLPGTTLSGDIKAEVLSEGTMEDLEKEFIAKALDKCKQVYQEVKVGKTNNNMLKLF